MLVPLFSDLHVHLWKDFSRTKSNGWNSRFANTISVLKRVRRWSKKHGCKVVLFGGDLFHVKHLVPVKVYQPVFDELAKYRRDGIELFAITGNHDHSTSDGSVHALRVLSRVITVIDKPETIEVAKGFTVRFVPYIEDHHKFKDAMQAEANILLAHGGINGAVTGPLEFQPEHQVNVDDIPDTYDFRFLGHYHRRQKMAEKCWYIGSPLQHLRGEAQDHNKGFLVYDTDKKTFSIKELHFPEFRAMTAEDALGSKKREVKGNFCDVTFDVRSDEETLRKTIEALKPAGLHLVPVEKDFKNKLRLDVDASMSHDVLVDKYIEEYAYEGLDREKLRTLARKYLLETL